MDKKVLFSIKKYVVFNSPLIIPHLISVSRVAKSLAKTHNIDLFKTEIASWGHDIFRLSRKSKIKKLVELHIESLTDFSNAPLIFLHGPLASLEFPRLFNYHDSDVLKAIKNHTIISTNPSPLEIIIFLADKLEPRKKKENNEKIIAIAHRNLEEALLLLIENIIKFHKIRGNLVHQNFITLLKKYN